VLDDVVDELGTSFDGAGGGAGGAGASSGVLDPRVAIGKVMRDLT
jgi:hypothetical protein